MKYLAFFFASSLLIMPIASQADTSSELIKRFQAIKSFDANFRQTIEGNDGTIISTSQGSMKVLRPGRFYWKSETPDEILVVADGKFIWTYDMELEQIVQSQQKTALGQSPAALLAGEVVHLGDDYAVSTANSNQCAGQIEVCYQLRPKDPDSPFNVIKVGFEGAKLMSIKINDALEQTIITTFSNVTLNGEVNPNIFDFTPPAGVDVMQGHH